MEMKPLFRETIASDMMPSLKNGGQGLREVLGALVLATRAPLVVSAEVRGEIVVHSAGAHTYNPYWVIGRGVEERNPRDYRKRAWRVNARYQLNWVGHCNHDGTEELFPFADLYCALQQHAERDDSVFRAVESDELLFSRQAQAFLRTFPPSDALLEVLRTRES